MMRNCIPLAGLATLLFAGLAMTIGRPPEIPFAKHALDLGSSETCAVADMNGDGKLDIVSGESWYEGPSWTKHTFRKLDYANYYIDNFSDLPIDVDGDGAIDLVSVSWFAKKVAWLKNPGKGLGEWKETVVESGNNVEFAFLVDIDNDGQARELLPQFGNANAPLTWYEAKDKGFIAHRVSDKSYGHGIGAGDVNGDKRADILTPKGWFEAPVDPRKGTWTFHADFDLDKTGFIYVTDINGDGRNDLLTSAAHDYGIYWLERTADGKWTKRMIDDSWSQGHAMSFVDLNGDGRLDIVTGKRFHAHNGRDPGGKEPLGIYWYESVLAGGKLEWVKHVVDYGGRTGGGMQIPVVDIDRDGDMDFAVGGKGGLFLFENLTRKAGKAK